MPKKARELSALEVGRLKVDGDHAVGGVAGLQLQIINGSRAWILRFQLGGRRRRMGLGGYPGVTLAQARDKARQARELIDRGHDPIQSRSDQQRAAQAALTRKLTFQVACERFIAAREAEWRNSKHRQQWENTLKQYAQPRLGTLHVDAITRDDVLAVLEPIWLIKTETATRVRGRIEQVLDWAAARGHREGSNPARWRGHLDKILAKPTKIAKVVHHPAVAVADAPSIADRIRAMQGNGAKALLVQILTAARSGEVRGMTWSELDLDAGLWHVPAGRMKGGRAHTVPLAVQAVQILRAQPRIDTCDLVFPSSKDTPLSDMTLSAVMRRLKLEAVPHGFRSTFRDWAAECTNHPNEVVEMALAHAIENKTEAAYRRGDLLLKRNKLMQEWADYCLPRTTVEPSDSAEVAEGAQP